VIGKEVAGILNMELTTVAEVTTENANKIFNPKGR
jgi:Tat protein secretion system quality control protein TatD with DNase activity